MTEINPEQIEAARMGDPRRSHLLAPNLIADALGPDAPAERSTEDKRRDAALEECVEIHAYTKELEQTVRDTVRARSRVFARAKAAGCTQAEIARALDVDEKIVRRVIDYTANERTTP